MNTSTNFQVIILLNNVTKPFQGWSTLNMSTLVLYQDNNFSGIIKIIKDKFSAFIKKSHQVLETQ